MSRNNHATKLRESIARLPEDKQFEAIASVKHIEPEEPSFMGFMRFLAEDPKAIATRTVDFYSDPKQAAKETAALAGDVKDAAVDKVTSAADTMAQTFVDAKNNAIESITDKAVGFVLGDTLDFEEVDFNSLPEFFSVLGDVLTDPKMGFMAKAMAIIGLVMKGLEKMLTMTLGEADLVEGQQQNLKATKDNAAISSTQISPAISR